MLKHSCRFFFQDLFPSRESRIPIKSESNMDRQTSSLWKVSLNPGRLKTAIVAPFLNKTEEQTDSRYRKREQVEEDEN